MFRKISTFCLVASVAFAISAWAAGGAPLAAQTGAAGRPDLFGQWQLNRELSDTPGSMGGGGGHGGGHGAGHGQGAEIRNLMLNAPASIVLTQDDHKVVLTEPDGHMRTLPTDNRKVNIDGHDVRTKWNNNRLVSQITVGDAKVIETYERTPEGRQLIVTVGTERHGQQVSIRWVYDAVKP